MQASSTEPAVLERAGERLARYDVLVGGLKLRQATGVLKDEDLLAINALLVP